MEKLIQRLGWNVGASLSVRVAVGKRDGHVTLFVKLNLAPVFTCLSGPACSGLMRDLAA
jgi:hypothetical protein